MLQYSHQQPFKINPHLIIHHAYHSQNETTISKLYLFNGYLKGKQACVTLTPLFHITLYFALLYTIIFPFQK